VLQQSDVGHERRVTRRRPRVIAAIVVALGAICLVSALVVRPASAAATATSETAARELTAPKAVVLGLVEGVTEWLPVSSTGHLHVTERLLDVGTKSSTKDAADTYAITIQAGAILAVLLLFAPRLHTMADGFLNRDTTGRRVLTAVAIAFVPSAVVGVVFEKPIKDKLFGAWPIVVAWIAGGIVLLVLRDRLDGLSRRGTKLEAITSRQALIIGLAQVLALWPGTSRSLVTILAGLFVGLNIVAAVEFSFLLGFLTLSAATAFEALRHGKELVDTYGVASPLIGFVVAFAAAAVAIKWMVTYLQRHDLSVFGWYRILVAVVTVGFLVTNVI
jgi:undecaprenyl-diphosphatase